MFKSANANSCARIMAAFLAPDERLLAVADVTSAGPVTIGVAVTDQRIVGVPKSSEHPIELQVRRGELTDVHFDKRLVFSYLIGVTGDTKVEFGIALIDERKFLQPFLDRLLAPQPSPGISLVKKTPPPPEPSADPTIVDELVKLADLHERGLLTDDEFQAAKAAVINGSP